MLCRACEGSCELVSLGCCDVVLCPECADNALANTDETWPLKCPYCKEQLDEKRVLALAGAKKRPRIEDAILYHAKRAAIMVDEELVECSTCEMYAAVCSKTDLPKMLQCYNPFCHSETNLDESRMKEKITDALVPVRCPKCRKAVVFDGGCTQMSCPNCSSKFCYVCGSNLGQEINIHEAYAKHYAESRTCAKVFVQYHDSDPINWPADEASIINKVHQLQVLANLHSLRAQDPASFDLNAGTLPLEFSLKLIQEGPPSFPVVVDDHVEDDSEEDDDLTALMFAAYFGYLETVRSLIASGANAHAADHRGVTALMLAESEGHDEVVLALSNASANSDRDAP